MMPKISDNSGILISLRNSVPLFLLQLKYNAIIQPHFDYADTVYDSTSEFA